MGGPPAGGRGLRRRRPLRGRGTCQNFVDPAPRGWRHAYYAENCPRLTELQAAYDPRGAFRFPQGIGRGGAGAGPRPA
ncbi:hypothetical protein DCW30_23340 [Streptomyces alfalfae]|uniref:BBE domain-containing protein n=1 Tax=Streptomyces alfalfae TaxID=1642299 RepID=UPI0009773D0B|nr:hypothetical protein D3X13_04400 [Streptomyces fradiae]QUI34962.1 BBE domain-containing protein [Streptomyces alfalfae]RXX39053.1 hypothetical protein DCW30_23340 [Streptomyces alfalfae]RZM90829.1 hypothetical protein D4104_24430 [Streptomyces alfalfae]